LDIDKKNNLWIGSVDGLYCFSLVTKQLNRFGQADGLAGNEISAVYIDKNGTKYIGSRGKGITVFSGTLTLNSPKYPLIGNTTPTCITSDQSGDVWIGTETQGLLCFRNGKIIKRYLKKDGLLSDLINLVSTDDNGNLYVGSSLGLNRINSKGSIFTYTGRNGFTGIEAKNNAVFKASDGCLWFGTAKGAICYNPKLDNAYINEPLTNIRKFTVNDKEHLLTQGIKLRYNENRIVFDYSSICLTNPDAVEYKVMLEGADIDWRPVNKQTSWSYPALPANHYKFKVIAKNNVGIWNRTPATFEFRINPPFYQTWWFISICVAIGLIGIVMYIQIRERNLIKEKLVLEETVRERTAEVVEKNSQLAMKNKDITDSILYASRIQNALLPPALPFEHTFTLLRPKDIVSGDFFWFLTNEDKEWMAAVDCTGHGVPGAFMSIIGNNSLNAIVKELGITQPAEILKNLDAEVIKTLHHYQHSKTIQDGMDMALICYDRSKHLLEFSGAFNPLWLIRNGELIETPANRFPIGQDQDRIKVFTNHEIEIQSGDTIYMFSDGYADQFGGVDGKKLKVGKFKEVILSVQKFSMEEQKMKLNEFIEAWKGPISQIDDILVVGRKFEF
jgi:serine phosphatase RsbU (regulator of sigma subunit)